MSYRLVSLDDGRCGRTSSCPVAITAAGEIGQDEFERFRAFIAAQRQDGPAPRQFIIHSNGGNVGGALKLGLALRTLGMTVSVGGLREGRLRGGFCGSACVFVLMGGSRRVVPNGSVVAVHSPRRVTASLDPETVGSTELAPAFRDKVLASLVDYARHMGVDPALIRLSMTVPHASRRVLTAAEIRRFRLATGTPRT